MTRPAPVAGAPADPSLLYRGWVQVGLADRIRRRGPLTVRRFGRDLTVSCDASGALLAVPAAHDSPGDGAALPTAEAGGIAFAYQRAPGDDPGVAPPPLPGFLETVLAPRPGFRTTFVVTVRSSLPSLVENAVDRAHFGAVHGRRVVGASPYEVDDRGDGSFWARVRLQTKVLPGWTSLSITEVDFSDPFNSRIRNRFFGQWFDLVVLTAPRGDHEVEIRFLVLSPRWLPGVDAVIHYGMAVNERMLIMDDNDVLATRTMTHQPVLSDADGPIFAIRRWLAGHRAPSDRDAGARSRADARA